MNLEPKFPLSKSLSHKLQIKLNNNEYNDYTKIAIVISVIFLEFVTKDEISPTVGK